MDTLDGIELFKETNGLDGSEQKIKITFRAKKVISRYYKKK